MKSTYCVSLPARTTVDMVLINCRTVNKNGHKRKDYVVDQDCDITAITETWLSEEEARSKQNIKDMCPNGYKMPHNPCTAGVVVWVYYIMATSTSGNLTQRPLNHLSMVSYF